MLRDCVLDSEHYPRMATRSRFQTFGSALRFRPLVTPSQTILEKNEYQIWKEVNLEKVCQYLQLGAKVTFGVKGVGLDS